MKIHCIFMKIGAILEDLKETDCALVVLFTGSHPKMESD